MTTTERTTCCVVGGGPAGMVLGLLLARAGVEVTVLEKHGDFLRDFRGDTVHPTTLDLLDELGLGDEFAKLPQSRIEQAQVPFRGGLVQFADFRTLPGKHNYIAMVPQWDLLDLLAGAAKQEPTFALRMNTEATGLVVDSGRVAGIEYRTKEGATGRILADLTVACDGRTSVLRAAAGLAVRDYPTPMDVWWFRLPREDGVDTGPEKPGPTPTSAEPPAPAPAQPSTTQQDGAPYVTPLVRKLAAENGVDLAALRGTGIGGRIRKQDVIAAAEAKAKAAEPAPAAAAPRAAAAPVQPSAQAAALRGKTEKMTRLRQTVARRMVESLQVSAQLTQVVEVDVTKIAKLRTRAKAGFEQREGVKLTFLPFFAKATVEALKQHPKLNASINDETKEVTYHGAEHLGIAVDTERGLLSPAIHNAGDLSVAGIAHKITDLAERTRANKVTPDELVGATFTLTNLGSQGALFDTPIIPQPQVGILGVGLVVKRPVVITDADGDDTIAVRSMVYLALTYDHRLVDGADAGRFLTTIKRRLEEGNFEADLGL
jgi:pyruvate/2-oxoglutarate dehydrogenase complex dihydrolipoamide acyltransferase (E2) component